MLEIKGDLFSPKLWNKVNAICITTNGIIKSNGQAVMGAGVAKIARDSFKGIDTNLGDSLVNNGNHVSEIYKIDILSGRKISVLSFPTKLH